MRLIALAIMMATSYFPQITPMPAPGTNGGSTLVLLVLSNGQLTTMTDGQLATMVNGNPLVLSTLSDGQLASLTDGALSSMVN